MIERNLDWRVEDACRNAAPSPREVHWQGWLFRFGGGRMRRTNSVNALCGSRGDAEQMIPAAERVYRANGRIPMLRVIGLADGHDALLEARGYQRVGHTTTLLATRGAPLATGALLTRGPGEDWIAARSRMDDCTGSDLDAYRTMLQAIMLPAAFASIAIDGTVVAIAYAVISDGLTVIEAVMTDPAFRRRGLGRRVVGSLVDWGWQSGAEAAALQVVADNLPARGLYAGLGFTRHLYDYHYRIALDR